MPSHDKAWLAQQLVVKLGWDSVTSEGVAEAIAAAQDPGDVDNIVEGYMGGAEAARHLVQQFLAGQGNKGRSQPGAAQPGSAQPPAAASKAPEAARPAGSLQIRHATARKGKGAASKGAPATRLDRKVVNCLGCGKVYDCRSQELSSDLQLFVGSGGICTFCGRQVAVSHSSSRGTEAPTAAADTASSAAPAAPGAKAAPESTTDAAQDQAASSSAEAAKTAEAVAFKDRLVDYDRNAAKRTSVVDDQADWFEQNVWLSDQERAELRLRAKWEAEAAEARRRRVTVTVDLLGRRVLMLDDAEQAGEEGSEVPGAAAGTAGPGSSRAGGQQSGEPAAATPPARLLRNPSLPGPAPMFVKPASEPAAQPAARAAAQAGGHAQQAVQRLQHEQTFLSSDMLVVVE